MMPKTPQAASRRCLQCLAGYYEFSEIFYIFPVLTMISLYKPFKNTLELSMTTVLKQLPNQPVFVLTLTMPFDPLKEIPATNQQFREIISTISGVIYRIIDDSGVTIPFNDMIDVLAADTREGVGADSRVRTVIVGSGEIIEMGTKAAKEQQYGGADVPMFGSMAEALAYVNAELAKQIK
jgi:hypothetical protein